jgi:hypothetical protein
LIGPWFDVAAHNFVISIASQHKRRGKKISLANFSFGISLSHEGVVRPVSKGEPNGLEDPEDR